MRLPQILGLKHPETLGSKDFRGINCSRFRVMQGLGKDRVWGLGFTGKEKISAPSNYKNSWSWGLGLKGDTALGPNEFIRASSRGLLYGFRVSRVWGLKLQLVEGDVRLQGLRLRVQVPAPSPSDLGAKKGFRA